MIPDKVKIGPFDFKIFWYDYVEGILGQCCYTDQILKISKNRKRQAVAQTLIHEIIHGINVYYGVENTKDGMAKEENIVDGVAYGWAAFVRDNPEFIIFLNDLLLNNPGGDFA